LITARTGLCRRGTAAPRWTMRLGRDKTATDPARYDAPERRGASVATATISSSGSMGFTKCI
jgi:hypothetical protein